jgi:hypothetical protein
VATAAEARRWLAPHGTLRPQSADEWTGPFAIPNSLELFFKKVGPVDVLVSGYGNPFSLPRLAALWDFQAGYRWDGNNGVREPTWDDDWLAVATDFGAVYILECSSGRVLFNLHGPWEPTNIFVDLNTMAACFGYLGTTIANAGEAYFNEDSTIRPECLVETIEGLKPILGEGPDVEEVLSMVGWA